MLEDWPSVGDDEDASAHLGKRVLKPARRIVRVPDSELLSLNLMHLGLCVSVYASSYYILISKKLVDMSWISPDVPVVAEYDEISKVLTLKPSEDGKTIKKTSRKLDSLAYFDKPLAERIGDIHRCPAEFSARVGDKWIKAYIKLGVKR